MDQATEGPMFELAMPWALIGLLLPLLAWRVWPSAPTIGRHALNVPFFNLIARLHETRAMPPRRTPVWLVLIWALITFAASGPRWVGSPEPLAREGHNIMLALDVSGSMAIDDMTWHNQPSTRLSMVKRAADAFVHQRAGDRIGLILFGTRAYLQTPLTYDRHNVHLRLEDATVGLAGNSTSLGDPIGLAVKHLKHAPQQGRLIILLTDGVNNAGIISPLKAASLAKSEGIKIHTIGLGRTESAHAFMGLGLTMNGAADLDEDTLKAIAKATGGHYFRATDQSSLQRIYQLINQMETVTQEQATVRPQHEYYPWFLALALCCFMGGVLHETGFARRTS